jgi:cobalt-zinc-cadmium efflux system outer membrane protein
MVQRITPHWWLALLVFLAAFLFGSKGLGQATPSPCPEPVPESLSLRAAVEWTLRYNPELAAIRQQHGIAAAGVVIARTYRYNPVAESTIVGVKGSDPAVDLESVAQAYKVTLDVEVRQQRAHRKQAALAALTRTDWEIATQELAFAVNAIRAFDNFLYRQGKLAVTEEFLKLNQQGADQVKQLVDRGTLRAADLILARAEVSDIQAQVGLNRTARIAARRDFLRALGSGEADVTPAGMLERSAPPAETEPLLEAALEHRPDLFARQAAVTEAQARLRLQIADRYGNPTVGPVFERDESRTNFTGVQFGMPIPIFNRRQGEIQQLQAQHTQALLFLQQTEVDIRRDVPLAVARLNEARGWVESYQKQILPDLRRSLTEMEQLFKQNQPGVDVLRVLDVRRKLLRAQDGYLDALLAYTQALADLAQAVGDPTLAMGNCQEPELLPKPKPLP